ncbi:MAG: tetratricopeptide repeat protein [Candidatus Aminicenantes bacterium]|nr:tetratricopeptide repeat protein [Candidatus Aminicenantes bacterium]
MLLILLSSLFAQTNTDELETRLSKAKGKERLVPLAELAETYQYESPGKARKALKYGTEALELLKTFPDKKIQASILDSMCGAARYIGDDKAAKGYAEKSRSIAEEINDKQGIARALKSLARVSIRVGEFEKALEYCLDSEKIYKDLNDQEDLADTYNLIAIIYGDLGDYDKAVDYYSDALKIYEALNHQQGIAWMNNNIGFIYWNWKMFEKSLEHYFKALEIHKKLDNKRSISITRSNIGKVYRAQKKYEESLQFCADALEISEEIGDNSSTSTILNYMGETHMEMEDYRKALDYFNQSLEIKRDLNDKKMIAGVLINLASLDRRLGNYGKALQQAMEALDIAQQIKVKEETRDAYLELSETYEKINNHREALKYYKKYKEKHDSIFDEESSDKIAKLQVTLEMEKNKKEIAILKKDRERQRDITYFLIIFACLILVLAFVVYTRYRLKGRVTRALEKEIEERKLTEEKLRESEEKFRVLAERSVVGIWIIRDNVIKYANPRHLKIFGYTFEEMIGKNPLELVVEEDRPLVSQHLNKRMTGTDNSLSYEFKGCTKAGEIIHLESYGSLTHFQGQPAVLETVIDITDRKKVEMELLKVRKLESVGILAGGIAHDFNNLLTIIIGNISMTKMNLERENVDQKNFDLLEDAEKASYQATDLAQKFITFSEGGWIAPRKLTLSGLLKNTINFYPELGELHYNISIPDDLKPLYGDERQLKEVIINLLLNASEAMSSQNNEVSINAENITLLPGNEFLLKEGEYVKISIKDKGKGIPANQLEKIFDPYFSTKNQVTKKGLGLGLAICYSIIKKHEGHISVGSEVGSGTTVNVYLPAFLGKQAQVLIK